MMLEGKDKDGLLTMMAKIQDIGMYVNYLAKVVHPEVPKKDETVAIIPAFLWSLQGLIGGFVESDMNGMKEAIRIMEAIIETIEKADASEKEA